MAFVAPVAGALFGGLISGWAGWGLSVGWLVGSWLFGPKTEEKNQVFDPGAEEMPLFNQALRGSTMPILFGTNRVASQIVWQKNFTTIRHESKKGGGGGKGGGSGLGGKAAGPESTNVTYEYKWDLMFHVGMSDVQLGLFGGWLNVERMNDATLLAIINNESSAFTLFTSDTDRPQNAELSFVEGFFHGAGSTGDATFSNWAHFETQEGGPYRWPYTAYIGLKQLNLGSSARTPQLSWEVGEGGMYLEVDNAGDSQRNTGSTQILYSTAPCQPFLGEDGKQYMFVGNGDSSNSIFGVWNLTDQEWLDQVFTKTEFQLLMLFSGYLNSGWAASKSVSTFAGAGGPCGVIYTTEDPDGKYFLATMCSTATFQYIHHTIMFKVNKYGQLALAGSYTRSNGLDPCPTLSGPCQVFTHGAGSESDPLLCVYEYNGYLTIPALPSVNEFKAGTAYDTAYDVSKLAVFEGTESYGADAHDNMTFYGSGYLSSRLSANSFPTQFGVNQHFNTTNTTYLKEGIWHQSQGWFMLPVLSISELGLPSWSMYFCFHWGYGKGRYFQLVGSGFDTTCTNIYNELGVEPRIFGAEFVVATYPQFVDNGMVDISDKFVDQDGVEYVMADVDGYGPETTSRYPAAGIHTPQVNLIGSGVAAGATAVLFAKCGYDDSNNPHPDINIYGTRSWQRTMVYIWNPYTKQAVYYGHMAGPMGDKADDYGESPTPSAWSPSRLRVFYIESTRKAALVFEEGDPGGTYFGYSEIGTIQIGGGTDITPPVIIYRILTSPVYGLGYATSDIDATSYAAAVQYCEGEDIKVSVQYRREESALQVIDDLLSLYGGFLTDSNGKIKFGLQEFTAAPIRTIDNDHLVIDSEGQAPVRVTKGARQDTYNKVKVNYFDRSLEYRQNFIELADEVDMDVNGVRAQEYPAKYVMKEKTANRIASRALWGNLYARDIYEFQLGPKDADLEPGDVITLVDSYNNKLSAGKQVRIVEWQEIRPLIFRAKAVDEIEYINASTLDVGSATEAPTKNSLFGPAAPPAYISMYELPKEFQGADAKLFVGYRQQNAAMGARLWLSTDGVTYSQMDDIQPYIISGILKEGLPNRDPGFVEENIEIYLMPDTRSGEFDPDVFPTYCQTFDLEDANAAGRAIGTSALWINSEMVAYENLTLIAQNHYRIDKLYRGWGGTHIQGHSSGDTWWRHGGGVFAQTLNQDKVGNIVYYKVQPYNFAGVGYNVSSLDARTYQIQGVYWKPQNPGALRTFVQSPGSYVTIQSEDLNFITKKQVIAGGSAVQIEWPDSSRESGYGALGYNYLSYGDFVADTTSHQYRIQVYSSDGTTVVRCTTVSTLAFLYDIDANSTDFNGWAGSFSVKVTPYNTYGDALRSRTKVLELFE